MKLTVVGLGYIGLPTSIMFAKHGVDVLGVDINQQTIDKLQSGQISIEEPGLQEVYEEVLSSGKLKVSTTPEASDVFIIAVPTPNNDDQYRSCDISLVMRALDSILPFLEKGNTIIVESTIAPKTMDDFVKPVIENLGFTIGEDIYLVHCPERVLPGKILEELVHNNRIIGGVTEACIEAGKRVYRTFVQGEMIETDARTAEMSKLMENTYRDVNIALANELTKICNNLNINVLDVIEMANKHPRVNIHQPGPGVGGHCLAVDPYFIIAVPTPNNDDQYRSCDISLVMRALDSILPFLEKGNTIIVESTIAPKTMDDFVKPVIENLGFTIGEDIYLVHCPERVLPGKILEELVHNNRIIGGVTKACIEAGKRVYRTFVQGEMIETDARTAEMSKLMENTYRDVNIALANELTKICNNLNINVLDVIEMANKHPRVNIHQPGPGVGGHCLAVDPYFIIAKDPENAKLIQTGREINNSMPSYVVDTTKQIIKALSGNKVTVFGLTYKGDVDDIRESPAFDIYELLNQEPDIEVCAYDPHVELDFVEHDMSHAVKDASLVLILSDHSEFKNLSDSHFDKMKHKVIFDTKNVVKSSFEDVSYYNYGNIFNFIDK
ncbi:capsular polysaccharide synthesis enzyme [Staphylococcus aureus]|nr:capsular polysaccharide synthesis enzyme [Staphylococcus aureus]